MQQLCDSGVKKPRPDQPVRSKLAARQPPKPHQTPAVKPTLKHADCLTPSIAQTPGPNHKVFDRLFELSTSKKKPTAPESDELPLEYAPVKCMQPEHVTVRLM
jgi:hypothetical protein